MPKPEFVWEDPDRGLPRQPVPLRFAYFVVGLEWRAFIGLLSERFFGRYEHLTAYEFVPGDEPRTVRRQFFEDLARQTRSEGISGAVLRLVPRNHFVWSDELANALSDFVDDCIDREAAHEKGLGLIWYPALHGLDDLVEECVDLSPLMLRPPLTRREQGKLRTKARNERLQQLYKKLTQDHPGKTDSWIAAQILKRPEAGGLSYETVRKKMKGR